MALNITVIIAALGFVPLLLALWKRKRVNDLIKNGDIVTGTVLEVYHRRGNKGNMYYQAVIEYPVYNQAPMQGTYTFSGKKGLDLFYRGRKLDVYYAKKNPKRFIPREGTPHKVFLIFGIVFAIGYLVLSYYIYGFMKDQGV